MMDIILKVARQVVAEKLTKNWLMAVRRGWLTLLKPSIQDLGDVVKAIDKLDDFIDRLQQQVRYVRRGPLTSLSGDDGKKLEEAFKAIKEVLREQRSRAVYWKEYLDGTAISLQWGEDRSNDARHMLSLYKEKFSDILEGYVPTRGKGPGGVRSANIQEYFDKILEILYADAKRIVDHDKAHPEEELHTDETIFTDFMIGRMKVVVVDPKIKATTISGYIQDLKTAYRLLQQAKLDSVWYGITFLVSDEVKTLTDVEKAAYTQYGYDISSKAGDYSWKGDMVRIWDSPPITSVLLHELGHRHWFKGMTQSERAKFETIVKVKSTDEKDDRQVAPVSTYGETNIDEAFAEVFMHYVLRRDMTRDQMESFKYVLKLSSEKTDFVSEAFAHLSKSPLVLQNILDAENAELRRNHNDPYKSISDFLRYDQEQFQQRMNRVRESIEHNLSSLKFGDKGVVAFRALTVRDVESFRSSLESGGQTGVYWSFTESNARPYWRKSGVKVVLRGQIPTDSVDFDKTLGAQTSTAFSRGEDEITVTSGRRVYVDYLEVDGEKHLIESWCKA